MGIVPTHPTNTRKQLCSHPFHFERFVPRRCQSPSESARYLSSTALTEINTPNQCHCWDLGRPRIMSCQTVREPFTLPLSLHSLSLSFLQLRHAMTSSFSDVTLPPGHRVVITKNSAVWPYPPHYLRSRIALSLLGSCLTFPGRRIDLRGTSTRCLTILCFSERPTR